MKSENITIVIAHYGLDRKISEAECFAAMKIEKLNEYVFVDFEAGNAKLEDLYTQSYDNIALYQQRKYVEILKPLIDSNPQAKIIYFGLVPIPLGFHLGYLIGNLHPYEIFQWHHGKKLWFSNIEKPSDNYEFILKEILFPNEVQRGKGNIVIRIATSFNIDEQDTYEVVPDPENQFDIELMNPHPDSLYDQNTIDSIVNAFQDVLISCANKLSDRNKIHLFLACSSGLPFALGTRINPNTYPYIQTYQFSQNESPKYVEAVLVTKETDSRVMLSDENRKTAFDIRNKWSIQLENNLKPFIGVIAGKKSDNWLQMICASDEEYSTVSKYLKVPWNSVTDINRTSLKHDSIDLEQIDVEDGFEYIEKSNKWLLDDGFLFGLEKRLAKKTDTDIMQASRLFFFHEALHYSKEGHRLTKEVANGIGQFPKVIEEADYQADVWGLLTEYKYCCIYETAKLNKGIKSFFCDAIETAIETMWSFVDTGEELTLIQIRSMNRFLNWYWQWVMIEDIEGKGTLEDVINILLDKPVIEFAGATMELRGYRTFYKLNPKKDNKYQLAAFFKNRVHRFTPNLMDDIISGFRYLDGDKIKSGLKSFQLNFN